ncbi:hypothetical protein PHIN3_189 [Sinorhizobium phage phiN3]|uniref:Uncharacterized protein n=1 Tax=Sinorhizobium phage phiN3 TaxID=1647405 RepID=A0A0F6WCK6_9CAUD|nr:hypothetical protein AVT40_gp344 [Sinorhizobium phage phiN3]AKF13452.1 hypothetical protein PHIN3_189 [Sinorhizobium phage phiN3]
MNKERFKELWYDDELEEVHEDIDDSWRHGNNVWTVYKYGDTYWQASYRVSGDGEYHGIRDDDFEIERVYPHEVVTKVTNYVTTPPKTNPTRYRRKFTEVEAIRFPGIPKIDPMNLMNNQEEFDELERFEKWIEANGEGWKLEFKYRGSDLIIGAPGSGVDVLIVPPGYWLVKEVARAPLPLSPEEFSEHYEKV